MTADNPLLDAALAYAARGWPVFPCNPKNKQPLLAKLNDDAGKPIPNSGGVSRASTDPAEIGAWWKRWPKALIGLATGHPTVDAGGLRLFIVDFDPRVEEDTGEVWTLERLKGELEAQLGCEFPVTLAALTPSDGVHAYLLQNDDGPAITNSDNLPEHVDVRGLGGYVIAPPSVMGPNAVKGQAGLKYRWHRKEPIGGIARAPARLVEVLRERKTHPDAAARPSVAPRPMPSDLGEAEREAIRKYALSGLDLECRAVRDAPSGRRNPQLNDSALKIASLVASGALDETIARSSLEAAARANPGRDDDRQLIATIDSGWSAGINNPRDLSEIAAAARDRVSRSGRNASSRPRSPSPPLPPASPFEKDYGKPSSQTGSLGSDDRGRGRGGAADGDLTRKCGFLPQTDLGNLERFLARYGADFLFVEAWGWLAWDGRRWNRDMAMALLGHAVQLTMRAIQDEAEIVRASGVPFPPKEGFDDDSDHYDDEDGDDRLPIKTIQATRKRKTLNWRWQRHLARQSDNDGERHDYIAQIKSSGEIVLFSQKIGSWGRTSEGAGHINCIAKLAEARLSAMPDDFDADPLLLNMENGTLVFLRPDEGLPASVSLRAHRREDRITKIGNASYDPAAACPAYDAFLEKVQPTIEMRDFLDTWAGYNSLGLADAQKMAVFYGEGSNGKGVWVATKAHILGDYAWSTGIETFMDAGRTRKGADASPDLAALAGRRMVYANEPEDNSKFADGLIKSLTSDESKGGVRELMKPPFELRITFTNTVMANNMPRISTDHGIQRRVQVIPWGVIIPDEEQDLRLKDKLKAEANGILNRMVRGALRYLSEGLAMPEAVKEATREYQAENDLLGGFLELCIARVKGMTVGATPLHRLFVAWQNWAGQLPQSGKPWSAKHLNSQMRRKSFKIAKSSTMQWQDVALRFKESDFVTVDEKGHMHPVEAELPPPATFADEALPKGTPVPPHPPDAADFLPGGYDDVPF
ncbi:MAG TPA: phage/plasmid primase, P4 family [Allosphingosinicella sp.]|nr:phage/plasmid primase, P4 family [Allosphingosinicella sp.]